ncbi:glycosyltransferase [Streptomyces sp. NPDC058357]|uniref:glycosyltransferase n=1 Tax=unclassified Streptomyces TaxID=2593676 RepID=UPI00365F7756
MRVVIVTESFPPDVNGVAHCTLQTARHLARRGHEPLVIAPATAGAATTFRPDLPGIFEPGTPCPVVRVPSLPLPGYLQVRVALPSRRLTAALTAHRAELVHLAGPFVLGVRGMAAAARLGLPTVAVYQTDLAGYARTYLGTGANAAWRRMRAVHGTAGRTLAPPTAALRDLTEHGVPRVRLWPRGVDTTRFWPGLRDGALRRRLAPGGETIVGYVGRLAPEKHVGLLARRLDEVCALLTGGGAVLLTVCLPDPGAVLGLPAPLGTPLARRQAGVNAAVHALSDRYDAVHLHPADRSWAGDRSLWSPDRLHPAERGHRTVAAGFHALLAARGPALGAPPGLEPRQPPPGRLDSWRRLATAGTGWPARRSTDLLPQLICLAGAELWHRARGTGAHLDRRAEEALRSALAALPPRGVPGTAEQAAPSAPVAVARARMEG